MAVAAYATLQSLSRVLNNLLHPARLRRLHVDTNQIQSLQEKVQFLLDFLEAHSQRISEEIGDTVIGKIDSLTKELTMLVKEEWADIQEEQRAIYVPVESQEVLLSCGKKSTMMGFDEHLERIVDKLTRDEPNLQILSIVGMGGIGKTTLAQNAFDHPYIVHYFPKRIWLTISQQYSVRDILLRFLKNGDENNECLAELGQRLYQNLFGERYLIVMDDVWSIKAWNALKLFFPNNAKGSRVMVTTRESNLAISLGSHESYSIDFLNEIKEGPKLEI
ncbi:UNVERIFIED_CONTAM: putative disease resistance protein, partial [Sesamum radiatum]